MKRRVLAVFAGLGALGLVLGVLAAVQIRALHSFAINVDPLPTTCSASGSRLPGSSLQLLRLAPSPRGPRRLTGPSRVRLPSENRTRSPVRWVP